MTSSASSRSRNFAPHLGGHRLADRRNAGDQAEGAQRRMRAIEDRHLARLVRGGVGHDDGVRVILGQRQAQLRLAGLAFDDEEVEQFAGGHEPVGIAELALDRRRVVPGVARHDAVDQRVVEGVLLLHPGDEGSFQPPLLGVAQHDAPEFVAVVVDQLAGDHLPAGARLASERLPALMQQARHLGREGGRWRVVILGRRHVGDAGVGGVGDDDGDLRRTGQLKHLVPVLIGADLLQHRTDDTRVGHLGAIVGDAARQHGVEAVLFIEPVRVATGDRPDDDDAPVEAAGLVHAVDLPVDEGAQEVAFAKLKNASPGTRTPVEGGCVDAGHDGSLALQSSIRIFSVDARASAQ